MLTTTRPVTGAGLKQAIESRDGRMLSGFYADDALVRVIDRNNPPSRPRDIRGRAAITTFWDDICSRAMTHRVDTSIAEGDSLAFTQACASSGPDAYWKKRSNSVLPPGVVSVSRSCGYAPAASLKCSRAVRRPWLSLLTNSSYREE